VNGRKTGKAFRVHFPFTPVFETPKRGSGGSASRWGLSSTPPTLAPPLPSDPGDATELCGRAQSTHKVTITFQSRSSTSVWHGSQCAGCLAVFKSRLHRRRLQLLQLRRRRRQKANGLNACRAVPCRAGDDVNLLLLLLLLLLYHYRWRLERRFYSSDRHQAIRANNVDQSDAAAGDGDWKQAIYKCTVHRPSH